MRTKYLLLILVFSYFFMPIMGQAQDCDRDHFSAFAYSRLDGTYYIHIEITSIRIKAVQARYKFTGHSNQPDTDWNVFNATMMDWPDVVLIAHQNVYYNIPWHDDRSSDYDIEFAVRAQCQDGVWLSWGNLGFSPTVPCNGDYWLESKSIGHHSATFNYVEGNDHYKVELSADGGQTWPISGSVTDGTNSITLRNLESNTRYLHRHAVYCNGRWSTWSDYDSDGEGITPFTTDCAAPTLDEINTENTPSGSTIEVSCFTNAERYQFRIREQGSTTWTSTNDKVQNQHTFTNLQQFVVYEIQCRVNCSINQFTDWSPSKEHVIPGTCPVPQVADIGARDIGTRTAELFCRSGHGSGNIDHHKFRYRKNGSSDWIEIMTSDDEVNIDQLDDNTQYAVQIRHECPNFSSDWSSSFHFTTEQRCVVDEDHISIRNINVDQADLVCQVNQAGYIWKYRMAGGGGLVEVPQQSNSRTTITGLRPGTTYEVALKVYCNPAFSEAFTGWEAFTTSQCVQPDNRDLTVFDITSHSVTFWNSANLSQLEDYTWQYRKNGNQNWQSVQATGHETAVTGLVSNSFYEYRLQRNCDAGLNSEWSGINYFNTPCNPGIRRFSNITSTRIKVLATMGGALQFQFRYRARGAANWILTAVVPSPEITVSPLMPNTEYEFQVLGSCLGGSLDQWSASAFASTRRIGLDSDPISKILVLDSRSVVCDTPRLYELSASNITPITAELGCSRGGMEAYQYQYSLIHDSVWIQTDEENAGDLVIEGLRPRSGYRYQARFKCGSEYGEWSDTAYFKTSKLVEYLSDKCYTPGMLRLAPTKIDVHSVTLQCRAVAEKFQFRYRQRNANEWIVLPDQTGESAPITSLKENTVYEYQCRLYCNGGWGSYSDSWLFSTRSSEGCEAPERPGFFAYDIRRFTAKLTCLHQADRYQYRYKELGGTNWTQTDTSLFPEVMVEDLEPGKKYIYQVRLQCNNGLMSNFSSPKLFQTSPPCFTASSEVLVSDSVQTTSARILCIHIDARSFIFRFRLNGQGDWKYTGILIEGQATLTGLLPQSGYEYQVTLACEENEYTDWSASAYFTTSLSTATRAAASRPVKLYPNPGNQFINLEGLERGSGKSYRVIDLAGRLILSGSINYPLARVPINTLAEGIYMFILENGFHSTPMKFIVSR